MATSPTSPLGSLRGQVLRWLLLPMAALVVINGGMAYRSALTAVDLAYDRTLLASARAIAERLHVERGRVAADVPYMALDIFGSDTPGRIYYKVTSLAGEFVSGYDDFPPMPANAPRAESYPALVHFYNGRYDGHPLRVAGLFQPIYDGNVRGIALIQVGETLEARHALITQILIGSMWQQAVLVLVVAILAWFALRLALRPLTRLRREVEQRRPTELTAIDPNIVHKEVRPLIQAINHYMSVSKSLIDSQRRFIADASHQLRTPLAVLKTQADLAHRTADKAELHEILAALHRTIDQAVRVSSQLLSLARTEQAQAERHFVPVQLEEIAREVCLELAPAAVKSEIDLTLESDGTQKARLHGDPTLLHELISNLVDNAIRYAGHAKQVTVRIKHGEATVLEVEDNGPGIPEADRARVFEPFYRIATRKGLARQGSGLGLAIVHDICRIHDAKIDLAAGADGAGLRVRIVFAAPPRLG